MTVCSSAVSPWPPCSFGIASACSPISRALRRCSWRTPSGRTPPVISASTSNGISSSSTKRLTFACQARALEGRGCGMTLRHGCIDGGNRAKHGCGRLAGDRDRRPHHVVELAQADLLLRQIAEAVGTGAEAGLNGFDDALLFSLHLAVDAADEPAHGAHGAVAARQAVEPAAQARPSRRQWHDVEKVHELRVHLAGDV